MDWSFTVPTKASTVVLLSVVSRFCWDWALLGSLAFPFILGFEGVLLTLDFFVDVVTGAGEAGGGTFFGVDSGLGAGNLADDEGTSTASAENRLLEMMAAILRGGVLIMNYEGSLTV